MGYYVGNYDHVLVSPIAEDLIHLSQPDRVSLASPTGVHLSRALPPSVFPGVCR
jgi:hypothetical protein